MGFFGTIREITKNSGKLKSYEQEQRDRKAKREELYKSREYTPEELQRAKELGKNIIDVNDVMDNHSESIAENVEEMCEPIVTIAPLVGLVGSAVGSIKYIIGPSDKQLTKIREKYLNTEEAKNLYREIREQIEAKPNKKSEFYSNDLLSKNSIKSIEDAKLRKRAEQLYKKYLKEAKTPLNKMKYLAPAIIAGTTIVSFVGSILYATKLQVDSSKIARFQARGFLEDPKAFVNYTPEQIEQAKAELEANPELKKKRKNKDKKLKNGFFRGTWSLFKDRKAYKRYKAQDNDESKLVTRELTPEEIAKAQKDKEIIQNTVRYINNQAEINSENMEVAAQVFFNATPFLGAAIGGAIAWIFNKTGFIDKRINSIIKNNCSEETQKLKQIYEESAKKKAKGAFGIFDRLVKWGEFAGAAQDDLAQEVVENGVKKLKKASMSEQIKRGLVSGLTHKGIRNWSISLIAGFTTAIAGSLIGMKLQKSAARAGRYTAKRELEKDPRNFIGFTEEEYKQVEDVKSNEKKPSKIKEYATFLPRVMKEYWAYQKYRRGEYKQNQLLREQLQKQEVTEEQLVDAQNLQRKLFNTFEKVDDNSQVYSESTEAAIQIAQPVVQYGALALILTPIIIGITMVAKGKRDPGWALKKITGLLGSSSWLMKSKPVRAYLNSVAKNLSNTMATTTAPACKPLGAMLKNTDIVNEPIIELLPKIFKNQKTALQDLSKMSKQQMDDCLLEIERMLYKDDTKVNMLIDMFTGKIKNIAPDAIDLDAHKISKREIRDIVFRLRHTPHEDRVDMLKSIFNRKEFTELSIERRNQITSKLDSILPESLRLETILGKTGVLSKIEIKTETIHKLVQEMKALPEDVISIMGGKENIEIIEEFLEKHLDDSTNILSDLLKDAKTQNAFGRIINNMNTVLDKLKQQPGLVKENSVISQLMSHEIKLPKIILKFGKELAESVDNPDKMAGFVQKWTQKVQKPRELFKLAKRGKTQKVAVQTLVDGIPSLKEGIPVPKQIDDLLQNIVKNIDDEANCKKALEEFTNALESSEFLEYFVGKDAKYIKANPKAYKFPVPKELAVAVQNLQKGIDNPKELKKAILEVGQVINEYKANGINKSETVLTSIEELTGGLKKSIQRLKKYNARDIKAMISMDPKGALNSLESKIKNLSEADFEKWASWISKEDALKIMADFKKILNNVPEKELKNIMKKAVEEFQKDPDTFMKMMSSKEKTLELVMTPGLQKTLAVTGVSWAVLSVGISYAINAWLAEMELKAGRLGVMKSLESLSDDRYYADVIAKN